MSTGYVWHELYAWHDTNVNRSGHVPAGLGAQPYAHFESPESKSRMNGLLEVSGLLEQVVRIRPRSATEEDLLRVHTPEHVAAVAAASAAGGGDAGDGVSPFGRGSHEIARLAAGGTIAAVEAVLDGVVTNAYALVRPPGHHARRETGMGFCLFANIAVAIEWARAHRGVRRVAVVDWDVHHGNGTQAIFEDDPDVLTISLHQDGLFPVGSGALAERGTGAGEGSVLNVPLPAGTGDGGYVDAVADVVVPALRGFGPELVLVASGFDASALDPLGNMVVTSSGYRQMARLLKEAAEELCGGRLVMSHEGGYSPVYVPYCGLAVLEVLADHPTGVVDPYESGYRELPAQRTSAQQREVLDAAAALAGRLRLTVP
ncbi:class II histone deacetylase [Kineococcus sp. T13]|uniref:class II histone deacetylase n=1 Tax=Kineococcus vitellinus TaxID=2696565 RepID=UPI00141307C1|nr:class II histone deacetylase [Kineococcus vitellinus]NAZ77654.1 class II histone deacetylase [Kineococcus vitellinus]